MQGGWLTTLGGPICCLLLSLGSLLAPETLTAPLQAHLRDLLAPGQRSVHWLLPAHEIRLASSAPREPSSTDLRDMQQRLRQLELMNAELQQRIAHPEMNAIYQGHPGQPLVISSLREASVLGYLSRNSELVIDQGKLGGVVQSAFVLEHDEASANSPFPIIDQGKNFGLAVGMPVYAGRAVMGRISQVGRWTSGIQLVTDPDYRGRAQLVRTTSQGAVYAAEGILQGQGENAFCLLRFIPSTEAVQVGDEVYTGGRSGVLPYPLYYGKVVHAELPPGAPHWIIKVEPALCSLPMTRVQVLLHELNPERSREEITKEEP